jgi:hypothetical protein
MQPHTNLFSPNYGNSPIGQNYNPALVNNNQLNYQRQLALQQQAVQRNQAAQIQNAQRPQQMQNIQNMPNAQLLNAQKIQQAQNVQKMQQAQNIQKMHKPQQVPNNIKMQNNQIPNTINQQVATGPDGKKIMTAPIQKNAINTQIPQNHTVIPNTQHHPNLNKIQGTKLNNTMVQPQQNRKLLASSHNPLQGQTLEPINQNQYDYHHILQNPQSNQRQNNNPQQIKRETLVQTQIPNQQKKETLNQTQIPQQQNNQTMDNLKNTAFMPMPNTQVNQTNPQQKQTQQHQNNNKTKKSVTLMSIGSLAGIDYKDYPKAELSSQQSYYIIGYGANTYNGAIKSYNEDKYKIENREKEALINGEKKNLKISYFGVFDGHGGDKCSIFLRDHMHKFLLDSKYILSNPIQSIRESFDFAERSFYKAAVQNGKLVDKSGSCAVIALFMANKLFSINLGDSRALYSRLGGQDYYQITRDHKPNDEVEKKRIESVGGQVYLANTAIVNGKEVVFNAEQFGKGFSFPYRLKPSGLAVSIFFFNYLGSKDYRRLLFKTKRIGRYKRNECCSTLR